MEIRGNVPPGIGNGTGNGAAGVPGPAAPPAPLPYEGAWRFTVPVLDVSVSQARRTVRELLRDRGVPVRPGLVQDLLLIVSELVTNAVRHAALLSDEIVLEVSVGADLVRVAVEDRHPYRPKALETDQGQTGGRGLLLVKAVTAEAGGACGADRTATGGKAVWAVLPLTDPAGRP